MENQFNKLYNDLKSVIAKTYGLTIDNNNRTIPEQINSIALPSLQLIEIIEKLFDSANLYRIYDETCNLDLVEMLYSDNNDSGLLYHRIASLYAIMLNTKIHIEKDSLYINLKDILKGSFVTVEENINTRVTRDLFPDRETETKVHRREEGEHITYILNILLAFFIRQIHNELFNTTISNLIAIKGGNRGKR
jgi:hypothetical protein